VANKVLHVITGLGDGGAEGVLTRICSASKGVDHVVISLTNEGKYGEALKLSGVTVYSIGMNPGKPNPLAIIRLFRIIRAEDPDLVQTWMYHADLIGGVVARLAGVRRVYWGVRQSDLLSGAAKKSTIMVARICARISDIVPEKIVCCAFKAKELHADLGYSPEKLVVIPNGYDTCQFAPNPTRRAVQRAELDIGEGEILLGMVGRFHPQKDHENLLRALYVLKQKSVKFRCLLVGKGLSIDNLWVIKKLDELGLTDSVLLAGPRKDIPTIMNALDIHVLSSKSEGFPNVIAEAMACGLPCVSTNVGDAEIIIGESGVVCNSEDSQKLAEGIMALVNEAQKSPGQWRRRKTSARTRIADKYSLDRMVMQYETVWGFSGDRLSE